MYVSVCLYVCGRVYMCVYVCVCVCAWVCVYVRVSVVVCVNCMHAFCLLMYMYVYYYSTYVENLSSLVEQVTMLEYNQMDDIYSSTITYTFPLLLCHQSFTDMHAFKFVLLVPLSLQTTCLVFLVELKVYLLTLKFNIFVMKVV